MTYRKFAGLFVLMSAMISWPAMADTFAPSHTCTQPVKPAQFNGNDEVDMFNDAVAAYKDCIAIFADEQNAAADVHRGAASQAIDEWNTFVSDNGLN
jgi:hypothetical protein